MKKHLFLFLFLVMAAKFSFCQLMVSLQLPAIGLVNKSQLWNMFVSNTTTGMIHMRVNMTVTDSRTGQGIFNATTGEIALRPGGKQLAARDLLPIVYTPADPGIRIDNTPDGFIPPGHYNICYSFVATSNKSEQVAAEPCMEVVIEPIAGPTLIFPSNEESLSDLRPQFSWLPPIPMQVFSRLSYGIEVVEIYTNQQPGDAIDFNIPIFSNHTIQQTSLQYPASGMQLQPNKTYAWRVKALNNQAVVAYSDIWTFDTRQKPEASNKVSAPYVHLSKQGAGALSIVYDYLKIIYFDETGDKKWSLKAIDLSSDNRRELQLPYADSLKRAGENQLNISLKENPFFKTGRLYQIELFNSRMEVYRTQFEFRKTDQ